jgi:putative peptidoglycan lipid II flippase
MGLNVLFSILFSGWFAQIGWLPLGGLALANSLATALEATALFIFMRRRLNGIEGKFLADGFIRCAVAALGMALGLWFWIQAAGGMNRWVVALGGVALGAMIYLMGVLILKVPEIQMLIGMLRRRLGYSKV